MYDVILLFAFAFCNLRFNCPDNMLFFVVLFAKNSEFICVWVALKWRRRLIKDATALALNVIVYEIGIIHKMTSITRGFNFSTMQTKCANNYVKSFLLEVIVIFIRNIGTSLGSPMFGRLTIGLLDALLKPRHIGEIYNCLCDLILFTIGMNYFLWI